MEKGIDFAAWVGQHAMFAAPSLLTSPTPGTWVSVEVTINGKPVGEFGQCALCAGQLGIRSIFGSGDLAFTKEGPGPGARNRNRGPSNAEPRPAAATNADAESYAKRNLGAIHFQPERARQMITEAAEQAVRRALADPSLGLVRFQPPPTNASPSTAPPPANLKYPVAQRTPTTSSPCSTAAKSWHRQRNDENQ